MLNQGFKISFLLFIKKKIEQESFICVSRCQKHKQLSYWKHDTNVFNWACNNFFAFQYKFGLNCSGVFKVNWTNQNQMHSILIFNSIKNRHWNISDWVFYILNGTVFVFWFIWTCAGKRNKFSFFFTFCKCLTSFYINRKLLVYYYSKKGSKYW